MEELTLPKPILTEGDRVQVKPRLIEKEGEYGMSFTTDTPKYGRQLVEQLLSVWMDNLKEVEFIYDGKDGFMDTEEFYNLTKLQPQSSVELEKKE